MNMADIENLDGPILSSCPNEGSIEWILHNLGRQWIEWQQRKQGKRMMGHGL